MTFLDPRNDWAFKRIFGSKESGPVLIGFLNDLLHNGRPVITQVQILDPYLPSQISRLKNTAVDVRATLADGSQVLIEMQMLPVAYFPERALYNAAKCLVSQLGRGAKYEQIRPVTLITVADCLLLPEAERWLNHYRLRERRSGDDWPAHGLELVFIELPKVSLPNVPVKEPLHDWLEFLKNAETWRNVPRAVTNPAVREATRMARFDSLSPTESQAMTARQLYRADQRNMRRHALEEGMRKGVEKGMQKASLDIAGALLARSMTVADVADATGLPLAAVKKLASLARSAKSRQRASSSRPPKRPRRGC